MANSSAAAAATFSDEIPNNKNKGTCIINFPFSPALPSCSIFDMIPPSQSNDDDDDHQKGSSFAGYIDLLSTNDFTSSSSSTLFDWFPTIDLDMSTPPATSTTQVNPQLPPLPVVEPSPAASEVLNNPATPVSVSSSISSSSNETVVANKVTVAENEHEDEDEEELEGDEKDEDHGIRLIENRNDHQDQTKKLLKPRKKKNKKQRPARVTFKTKSEVDHMDDGYRWRKYGQKPVKNSPYPRSYYRCTAASCEVKKRIERSAADSSIVLTSYEGQHTHLSPVLLRAANLGIMPDPSGFQEQNHQHHITTRGVGVGSSVLGNEFAMSQSQQYQQLQDQYQNVIHQQRKAVPSLLYNTDYNNSFNISPLLNVVNSADNFLNSSKSFGGFLQNQENYGGGNTSVSSSMLTANDPARNNNGLLQDMFVPMEMGGAGAGEGR